MPQYSIEDPVERYITAKQLPPGNQGQLAVGDLVSPIADLKDESGTLLSMKSKFVLRAITSTPTVHIGTIELMGLTGTTGEFFEVKLPLLVKTCATSVNMAAALRGSPTQIVIGEARKLSRRRARKLAYQYRGGRRGKWYSSYLRGVAKDYLVDGRRLVRMPRFGALRILTIHSV